MAEKPNRSNNTHGDSKSVKPPLKQKEGSPTSSTEETASKRVAHGLHAPTMERQKMSVWRCMDDRMEPSVPNLNRSALSVPSAGSSPRLEVVIGTTHVAVTCLDRNQALI